MTNVLIPGGRDVRATLDRAEASDASDAAGAKVDPEAVNGSASDPTPDHDSDVTTGADAVVVACPPHPKQGGNRSDGRVRTVSDALVERGIDCLRFDYGAWDEGYGETADADNAVAWALDRYDRVGLFGFSFGGCVALVTAASRPELDAVCALAPTARLNPDLDAVESLVAIADHDIRALVVYATRDTTADWEPVVDRAARVGVDTIGIDGDHFLVGRETDAARPITQFFNRTLVDTD